MKKTVFGDTGMVVSPVGCGGIPIMRLGRAEAIEVIRHAFESGVNFYDTANIYKSSEEKLGEALQEVRDQVHFATKSKARDAEKSREHLDLSLKQLQDR
jgi:aryl-alcohol dehydrogenase-like predicted oxidoreductase